MNAGPRLIFLAGPNGAGKSTFYEAYLKALGLPFINADQLTVTLGIPNDEAARAADRLRRELVENRQSFITETVFSDPVGAKLEFLQQAMAAGYQVTLLYIGISDAELSEARVFGRVQRGGHDVPSERLARRFEQSLKNLAAALLLVSEATVFDNSSAEHPFRLVLTTKSGEVVQTAGKLPAWLKHALTGSRLLSGKP